MVAVAEVVTVGTVMETDRGEDVEKGETEVVAGEDATEEEVDETVVNDIAMETVNPAKTAEEDETAGEEMVVGVDKKMTKGEKEKVAKENVAANGIAANIEDIREKISRSVAK